MGGMIAPRYTLATPIQAAKKPKVKESRPVEMLMCP